MPHWRDVIDVFFFTDFIFVAKKENFTIVDLLHVSLHS